jgi:hypothetical protein
MTRACGELVVVAAARSVGLGVSNGGWGGCSVRAVGFSLRVVARVRGIWVMQWRHLGWRLSLGRPVGGEKESGQAGSVARLWPKA